METSRTGKLPFRTKLAYGIGTGGESAPYNMFYTYFVFFLTNVAGISAAIAGTISLIAILWDAVTDPVVGYLTDNSRNPKGRRTPFMSRSIWPLAIVLVFLFSIPKGFNGGLLVAYYIFMCVCLWTAYTTYGVPYAALGAEMTNNYSERNILRMFVGLCAYPFVAVVNSGTMAGIAFFTGRGMSYAHCWTLVVTIISAIVVVCVLISIKGSKKYEFKPQPLAEGEKKKEFSFKGLFKEYGQILKVKQFRRLNYFGVIWVMGYTLMNASAVYVMTYCAGLNEAQQATFWSVYTIFAICCTPIPVIAANKIGKKRVMIIHSAVFTIAMLTFNFTGLHGLSGMLIWGICVAFSTSAFWALYYSCAYDCSELLEWTTGRQNQGGVVALTQFIQKLGAAIATWIMGLLLSAAGYTGSGTEAPETVANILHIGTLIPGLLVLVSIIFFTMYRLDRSEFESIITALKAREETGIEDDSAFRHIL